MITAFQAETRLLTEEFNSRLSIDSRKSQLAALRKVYGELKEDQARVLGQLELKQLQLDAARRQLATTTPLVTLQKAITDDALWRSVADTKGGNPDWFADLVLPEGYVPSRAHALIVELAPLGLPTPKDTILLRVRLASHEQAKENAEAAELLVLSLLAHVVELAHVDARRVFLFAGERDEAALAWCIALHHPDRFAGVLAGPGGWSDGAPLACNAALFASVGILGHKGTRTSEAFLDEVRRFNPGHVRLESLGDRGAEPDGTRPRD